MSHSVVVHQVVPQALHKLGWASILKPNAIISSRIIYKPVYSSICFLHVLDCSFALLRVS